MPAQRTKARSHVPAYVFARLVHHVTLKTHANGTATAYFDNRVVSLGPLSAAAAEGALALRKGLSLRFLAGSRQKAAREIASVVRRLAQHGLLEYRVARSPNAKDQVVIEPQVRDFWPRMVPLGSADVLALSRFAYLRRRGNDMVLESPSAGALFRICDPKIALALVRLSKPWRINQLRAPGAAPSMELLALLVDCGIVFKVVTAAGDGLRPEEGDADLVLWDFHDLVFHARSTEGRHANPASGVFPYADFIPPLPAVRPSWPGKKIDLRKFISGRTRPISALDAILRERRSTRHFDDRRPITIRELARFLAGTARVVSKKRNRHPPDGDSESDTASRSYPSAGGSYELELYLAVDNCKGLARGFYHYDAGAHALVQILIAANQLDAMFHGASDAMAATVPLQVLITIAARFGRVSWKYSSIAYALILKDVGVLTQTFYLMAAEMGLGGCAIGRADIDLFAKMTGLEFHIEGPVGAFAIGRSAER